MKVAPFLVVAVVGWVEPSSFLSADDSLVVPTPDLDRIALAAQQITPGEEYVESLPARRAACAEEAPVAHTTAGMLRAASIRTACLRAMMLQLGKIYYGPRTFGEGGVENRFDELYGEIVGFLDDTYAGTLDCFDRGCGTLYAVVPGDVSVEMLTDLVEMTALATGRVRDITEWQRAWNRANWR